jgi:hypothetical protein
VRHGGHDPLDLSNLAGCSTGPLTTVVVRSVFERRCTRRSKRCRAAVLQEVHHPLALPESTAIAAFGVTLASSAHAADPTTTRISALSAKDRAFESVSTMAVTPQR